MFSRDVSLPVWFMCSWSLDYYSGKTLRTCEEEEKQSELQIVQPTPAAVLPIPSSTCLLQCRGRGQKHHIQNYSDVSVNLKFVTI